MPSSPASPVLPVLPVLPVAPLAAASPVPVVQPDVAPVRRRSTTDPRQLLVLSFDSRLFAAEALLAVHRLEREGLLVLHDAVFVSRDADGRSVVEETRDPDPTSSALGAGFWGLLFGTLLAGPVGGVIVAGAGAGLGALAAVLIDTGVSDETVRQLRASLPPGRTALALLVSHLQQEDVVTELRRFAGAALVQSDFSPDLERAVRAALNDGDGGGDDSNAGTVDRDDTAAVDADGTPARAGAAPAP